MKKAAILVAVLAAGCNRDLSLPGESAFVVSASPSSVAPRQVATITVSGGAGGAAGLTFGFDAGGKLSGDDAKIVSNGDGTATYTAGQNGSTQDTIAVTDASGAVRRVILTVGARLTLTPQVTATAPGGSLLFVASGGKAPYDFTTTGVRVTAQSATTALYVAGTTGDVEETVTVTDATHDAAAAATATIRVGTKLQLYRPTLGKVAPNEVVTVVAFGGRAPYTFSPPYAATTGGFEDAAKGEFKVGTTGATTGPLFVTATVTDANGMTASTEIEVGPALSATLGTPLCRPGVTNHVVASGGKSPFKFRFARRGNHSGGEVDAVSGAYVPGPSPGALDRLEVEDATGTVVALVNVPAVGPLEIATARDADRCVAGDYDGDGMEDLAFLFRGMSLLEVNRIATDPLYRTYYIGDGFMLPAAFAEDLDADGREELHFIGSRSGGPTFLSGGTTRDLGYWVLDPDMTGLFGNPAQLTTSPFTSNLGTRYEETVAGAHYTYFMADRNDGCAANTLSRFQWLNGNYSVGCSPPIVNSTALGMAIGFVAGDFTGDGNADFAWLASSSDPFYANTWNTPGPIYLRYTSAGSFADGGSLALPSGTSYEGQGNGEQNRILRVPPVPGSKAEGLLVRLRKSSGEGVVAFAKGVGNQLQWAFTPFNPFASTGGSVASIALYSPRPGWYPLAIAFAGTSGGVAVFDPWLPDPTQAMGMGQAAFPISYGCAVDADADGFPDFALGGGGTTELAALLWGDGSGGLGTRPRLATGAFGGVSGDLDGDGLVDVVTPNAALELTAMFGDAGQLGWSETSISTLPIATAVVAHFVDQGVGTSGAKVARDSVLFQALDGDYYLVRTNADGSFQAPSVLATSSGAQIVPRVTHSFLLPADLGGVGGVGGADGTGPDLIAPANDNYGHSWIHVLLRPDADVNVQEYMSPVVGDYRATGGVIVKTHQCAYAPVHDVQARHSVASLCAYEVTGGQPAAEWRVRGWPLGWTAGWYDQPWADVGSYVGTGHAGAAGTESTVVAIGEFGGKAYFLVATDRLVLAVVNPGANALTPSVWSVSVTDLTAAGTRRATPFLAQLVDLDGNGARDVVAGGEGTTVILKNTGTDAAPVFTYAGEVAAAGYPVAVGPLGFTDAAGTAPAAPSAVLAGMRGSYFQLLAPDGSGSFK